MRYLKTFITPLIIVIALYSARESRADLSNHQALAQTYIDLQIGEGGLYDWYKEESFVMVNGFEQRFEFHKKRKLSLPESRALYNFFRQQLINIYPSSVLQLELLPFVMKTFSESELMEIIAFLQTASGKKLAATQQAMQAFIKVTTSESYPARFTKERAMTLRKEFDAQFPELSIPWAK